MVAIGNRVEKCHKRPAWLFAPSCGFQCRGAHCTWQPHATSCDFMSAAQDGESMQGRRPPGLPVLPHAINAARSLAERTNSARHRQTHPPADTRPAALLPCWTPAPGSCSPASPAPRASATDGRTALRRAQKLPLSALPALPAWGRREPRRSQASRRCCACGLQPCR